MANEAHGSVKSRILELMDVAQAEQDAFVAQLSAEEKSKYGVFDAWSVKDHIANNAAWFEDATRLLTAAAQGETPAPSPNDGDRNPQIFAAHERQSWDEVMEYAATAFAELRAAIEANSEENLSEADRLPWREGNPLWVAAFIIGFQDPGEHYEQYYIETGDVDRAFELREKYLAHARRLFGGTRMYGYMLYNTAWLYAKNGKPDQAIGSLRDSLDIVPDIRGWAREDPDLAALHDHPEYQAIVADPENSLVA